MVNYFTQRFFYVSTLGFLMGVGMLSLSSCTSSTINTPVGTVNTESYEAGLAKHLQTTGAKMYGAYWCPHCADQKALFQAAVAELPYIECDPKGENPQTQLCRDKKLEGYPTWEIRGKLYPGVRSLPELATLSGYQQNP